jgi:hypothetical protein
MTYITSEKCANCGVGLPDHESRCVTCGAPASFPNVRHAARERAALDARVAEAVALARESGTEDILESFRAAVDQSIAIWCRNYVDAWRILNSDTEAYQSYYKQLRTGQRLPEDNAFDPFRESYDATLFPNYHWEIQFASLSLEMVENRYYGPVTVVLSSRSLELKASVFETNSRHFVEKKELVGKPIPPGYRASWSERGALCIAKLGAQLNTSRSSADFQGLLLDVTTSSGEMIEVHIYGPIHRTMIERIGMRLPTNDDDKVLYAAVAGCCNRIGIMLEPLK